MKTYRIITRTFALVVLFLGLMQLFHVEIVNRKVLDVLFLVILFLIVLQNLHISKLKKQYEKQKNKQRDVIDY